MLAKLFTELLVKKFEKQSNESCHSKASYEKITRLCYNNTVKSYFFALCSSKISPTPVK